MEHLRRIWRGTEGHPGTPVLVAMFVLGWLAAGNVWGGAIVGGIVGPFWLYGCWERGAS